MRPLLRHRRGRAWADSPRSRGRLAGSRGRLATGALLAACASLPFVAGCADESFPPADHRALRAALNENGNAAIASSGGEIKVVSLRDAGVTDIQPLAGLPLIALDLTGVPIDDLTPLRGMPLEELFLAETRVADLSPLAGMPLRRLVLSNTQVTDVRPLAGMPLLSLDMSGTPVADIAALRTLRRLQRLNIAGTAVADLSPLADLPLTKLEFTPSRIERGLDAVPR